MIQSELSSLIKRERGTENASKLTFGNLQILHIITSKCSTLCHVSYVMHTRHNSHFLRVVRVNSTCLICAWYMPYSIVAYTKCGALYNDPVSKYFMTIYGYHDHPGLLHLHREWLSANIMSWSNTMWPMTYNADFFMFLPIQNSPAGRPNPSSYSWYVRVKFTDPSWRRCIT